MPATRTAVLSGLVAANAVMGSILIAVHLGEVTWVSGLAIGGGLVLAAVPLVALVVSVRAPERGRTAGLVVAALLEVAAIVAVSAWGGATDVHVWVPAVVCGTSVVVAVVCVVWGMGIVAAQPASSTATADPATAYFDVPRLRRRVILAFVLAFVGAASVVAVLGIFVADLWLFVPVVAGQFGALAAGLTAQVGSIRLGRAYSALLPADPPRRNAVRRAVVGRGQALSPADATIAARWAPIAGTYLAFLLTAQVLIMGALLAMQLATLLNGPPWPGLTVTLIVFIAVVLIGAGVPIAVQIVRARRYVRAHPPVPEPADAAQDVGGAA